MSKSKVVYEHLLNENDREYTIKKTVEELLELALILQQRLNKEGLVPDEKIIEEIGDVTIRMKVLKKMFSAELIKARIKYKINRFYKYITEKKYKNI